MNRRRRRLAVEGRLAIARGAAHARLRAEGDVLVLTLPWGLGLRLALGGERGALLAALDPLDRALRAAHLTLRVRWGRLRLLALGAERRIGLLARWLLRGRLQAR